MAVGRLEAAVPIQPPAWEPLYAADEALKSKKKKKKKKKRVLFILIFLVFFCY